jgi:hypothetical protein
MGNELTLILEVDMLSDEQRHEMIDNIRMLPAQLEALVRNLDEKQLTTHFLPNEWTVAQNVHHLADSHMNSFIRLKLILTEDNPTLKPYDQDEWAKQPDANNPFIQDSLTLLKGLHARWVTLFESLTPAQRERIGFHPESGEITPDDLLRIYAAHGEGHLDQIKRTLRTGSAAAQ